MNKRRNIASWGILALVAAAILGGFFIAGGPQQGRMEMRDQARRSELIELRDHIGCMTRDTGALPSEITKTPACPGDFSLNDPFTDDPYQYEILDNKTYRLCARMELENTMPRYGGPEFVDGCLIGTTKDHLDQMQNG